MRTLQKFLTEKKNIFALSFLMTFFVVSIAAPWIAPPEDPNSPSIKVVEMLGNKFIPQPPGGDAVLGTLPGQIDVFQMLVWGFRSALRFSLIVVGFTSIFGTLIGSMSGLLGGKFNELFMRVSDAFLAFPAIGAAFLVQQLIRDFIDLGTDAYIVESTFTFLKNAIITYKLSPILLSLVLLSWVQYSRLSNSLVLKEKNSDYIEAARSIGIKPWGLIFRHLFPNIISPILVLAARNMANVVFLGAALSFIGLGESTDWGFMLVQGRDWIAVPGQWADYWWVYVPVMLVIFAYGFAWIYFAERVNIFLDPKEAYQGEVQ